jgi:hypothetical protein
VHFLFGAEIRTKALNERRPCAVLALRKGPDVSAILLQESRPWSNLRPPYLFMSVGAEVPFALHVALLETRDPHRSTLQLHFFELTVVTMKSIKI